jgi:hypothetical protein
MHLALSGVHVRQKNQHVAFLYFYPKIIFAMVIYAASIKSTLTDLHVIAVGQPSDASFMLQFSSNDKVIAGSLNLTITNTSFLSCDTLLKLRMTDRCTTRSYLL